MMRRHDLTSAQFDALAGGYGGADTVRALSRAQLSKHLLLIKFIAEVWNGDRGHRDAAVDVLTQAQAASPDKIAELLADPLVGAWAAHATRRLRGGRLGAVPLPAECNHLSAIAAAAAALAGIDARLVLHAAEDGVTLPRLGRALPPAPAFRPVTAVIRDGQVSIDGATGWQVPRTLTATAGGRSIRVTLDDLDPYRGGHHAPAAARLDEAELAPWRDTFAAGWALVARYAPQRADELAAGLRTLVPLAELDDHSARSATIRDAFGAFGLTRPGTATGLAVTLVHEFQHSKLSGVLDVQPLFDSASTELHFAPWRTDPRPVGGLLQGVYAFLGIADLWSRLRAAPALADRAEQEFAVAREQVRWGLAGLDGSAALNPAGRRFTAGIRAAFDAMAADRLPAGLVEHATGALRETHADWQRRNAVLPLGG